MDTIDYKQLWEEKTIDYKAYRELMATQVEAGETSGPIQNESLANYTKLNHSRSSRLDRKITLKPFVEERIKLVRQPQNWLVITETWCGDAAQILPVLNKMAETSEHIQMKTIWRDENLKLMDKHLSNGSRAIPKLICLNEDFTEVLGEWGARPRDAQELVVKNKEVMAKLKDKQAKDEQYAEFQIELQKWYNANKGEDVQLEMLVEIEKWQM